MMPYLQQVSYALDRSNETSAKCFFFIRLFEILDLRMLRTSIVDLPNLFTNDFSLSYKITGVHEVELSFSREFSKKMF
jgi:hypothetical protein